ncbi:hypothetical protein A3J32_01765 [Candidatus Saccharibacteria bacterium RIFCSPLOWO2_02_FULL_46_7]|nr:MAG: hypothetical protein A3J32_01765 [Candidatus Saccharibacteria bacterium RIFCSPLOWO2_02_FULL_46_7]
MRKEARSKKQETGSGKKPKVYRCPICGLHYYTQRLAKDCEAYCSEHNACSVELMRHSVEHQPKGISSED